MKFTMTTPQARRMTASVAGLGFCYNVGEVWVGDALPAVLFQHSEPYDGDLPPDVHHFDLAVHDALTKPRVEPRPPRRLEEAEVLQRFEWTEHTLETAIGGCGFPRHTSEHDSLLRGRRRWWHEAEIDNWLSRIRSLRLQV